MESDQMCYGKLIDIVDGNQIYLKHIPCIFGRYSYSDSINNNDSKNLFGKNVELDLNDLRDKTIIEYNVRTKVILGKCKRISPYHLILFYDFQSKSFKVKALEKIYINEILLNENSETIYINSFDKIAIECNICYVPHIYVVVFPKTKEENTMNFNNFSNLLDFNNPLKSFNLNVNFDDGKLRNAILNSTGVLNNMFPNEMLNNKNSITATNIQNKLPDIALGNKWTNHEKECLRKYILIYGYGRWKIIKHNSRGVLSEIPELELKIYSNAFIKVIIEYLPQEKLELRKFLINLINEQQDEPFILAKKDDWGTLLKQRAPAWGKRIQLIFRVCLIIEKFKSERKKNKEIRKKIDLLMKTNFDEEKEDDHINQETEKMKLEINKTFDYWDNLLNFLPNHAFYGQRPSVWWTRSHDIDLLRGTYKHGYANYQIMRNDPKLSFSKLEKDSNFQEFPNADTITRRLKKLIQIIIKSESSNGIISFEDKKSLKEPTGFNFDEKNKIINFLADYGVPLNNEGKSDWGSLKDQLVRVINLEQSKTPQMIERLVQRIRMISQLVIQLNGNDNSNDSNADDNMNEQMDPDNDGFNISLDEAERLNKNMNILHFIRKYILSNNSKLFYNGLSSLIESTIINNPNGYLVNNYLPYSYNIPEGWDCNIHDKGLLNAVADNGVNFLHNISNNQNYNFLKMKLSYEDALNRVNYLCEFFRDFTSGNKNKKKNYLYFNNLHENLLPNSNTINNPNFSNVNNYGSSNINNHNTNNNNIGNKNIDYRRKSNKLSVNKDEYGNIQYPIIINSALQIFNLGEINYEKSSFHSEKNLFPIGFKSIREHSSMFKLGERTQYTCEILDGGNKPLYKLTPHEDPEKPIIKESSTGCWIVVCNKINEMQNNKRTKVTISGTERFGLCEPNVVKLLQSLPGAEKCSKYIMKNFDE